MKYAVISDLHANAEALGYVLSDARACGAERIVCLGDVVGYGPLPAETILLVRERCDIVLAGNHDDAVSGRGDASSFIDLAGDAVARHREALSLADLEWLRSLPYTSTFADAVAAHGDLTDPKTFYYIENAEDARANFEATNAPLIFVGHTHVPQLFLTGRSGTVYRLPPQDFVLEDGKRYIVNVGSVGYPREADGKCCSTYALYDTDTRTVSFRSIPFSVASVLQRGHTPRRRSKTLLIAVLTFLALSLGTTAWLFAPKSVESSDDPALVVVTKTVPLDAAARNVRANLRLEKDSAPVALRRTFRDADGREVQPAQSTLVKKASTAKFDVPAGAASVEFTVLKARTEDRPALASFTPATEN